MSVDPQDFNAQWKTRNKESYPDDVFKRIHQFLNWADEILTNENMTKGIEIGAGNCYLTDWLKDKGYEIIPTDLYPSREDVITNWFGEPLDINPLQFSVANHVLEHIPGSVLDILSKSKRYTNSLILFAVPNSRFPTSNSKPYDETLGHCSHWTADLITDACEKLGINILKMEELETDENYHEIFFSGKIL